MTFGHTGEAHWAELNMASALGSLTAPAPKVKVKVKVRWGVVNRCITSESCYEYEVVGVVIMVLYTYTVFANLLFE